MNTRDIVNIVRAALTEDIAGGDVTTNRLVPAQARSKAVIIAKAAGIIGGLDLAKAVFTQLDKNARFTKHAKEGAVVRPGAVLATIHASTRALLTGERVALNFLGMVSGIATRTHDFTKAVKPYRVAILDTRKTTPTLRALEDHAVRLGGGTSYRVDLHEAAMIKDNHRQFAGEDMTLKQAVDLVKKGKPIKVTLEVDTLSQLKEALGTRAEVILLDNMTPSQTRQAVALRNKLNRKILLESSGGITLKNVRQYAAAGVERISIGSLTHSRQALDVSLELCP